LERIFAKPFLERTFHRKGEVGGKVEEKRGLKFKKVDESITL
jgi:hypothetical protein